LEKRNKHMPADLVEWLEKIIHESADNDEMWWSKGENHGDVFHSYLNSDRGAAFNALISYYRQIGDAKSILKQWEMIEWVAVDSSTALRAGAVYALTFMIRYDRNHAIELFELLISGHEIILTLMTTREFLYWSFSGNFLRLYPFIVQMINDNIEDVRNQGAQLACIALISKSLLESEDAIVKARELVEKVIIGDAYQRRGAATIFSHNLANYPEDVCEEYLTTMLNDEDEQVQEIIDRVFHDFDGEHILSKKKFIESYAHSTKNVDHFYAEFMLNYGMLNPRWAIQVISDQINNVEFVSSGKWHSGIDQLIRLVLKIYTNATEDDLQNKAMDVFDELLQRFAGSAHKILSEWDRR